MTMDEWSATLLSILACCALVSLSTAESGVNPVNPQQGDVLPPQPVHPREYEDIIGEMLSGASNVALGKDVVISPDVGTCGADAARSTIYEWRYRLPGPEFQGDFDERPQEEQLPPKRTCAEDCLYKTKPLAPQTLASNLPERSASSCSAAISTNASVLPCWETLTLDNSNYARTYVFTLNVTSAPSYPISTIIQQDDFSLEYNASAGYTPRLQLKSRNVTVPINAQVRNSHTILIQYDARHGVNAYVVDPSRVRGQGVLPFVSNYQEPNDIPSSIDGRKAETTLYVGASKVPDQCEFLKIERCRRVGHSISIAPLSQTEERNAEKRFPLCAQIDGIQKAIAEKYLCALHYPVCLETGQTRRPCKQYCQYALDQFKRCPDFEAFQMLDEFNCDNMTDATDCINHDSTIDMTIFEGSVQNLKAFDSIIGTSDYRKWVVENNDPSNSGRCTCGGFYPFIDNDGYCKTLYNFDIVPAPNIGLPPGTFFYSKYYLTDDQMEIDGQNYWASTPGVSPVSITIDLEKEYLVYYAEIFLYSPPPAEGIIVSGRSGSKWKTWWHFAVNCSLLNLPSSGIPVMADSVGCTDYKQLRQENLEMPMRKKRQIESDPELQSYGMRLLYINFIDSQRPGLGVNGFMDDKLQEFITSDALKIELLSPPSNAASIPIELFHIISEVIVEGKSKPFSAPIGKEEPCHVNCYQGSVFKDDKCECECVKPFEREKAGPQCVPYITSIFPTYGPIAGGTNITITGGLFGSANSTVKIILKSAGLRDVMCPIFAGNSTVIKCTTPKVPELLIGQPFILQLWDSSSFINAPEPFTFKPDPLLTSVYPNTAIVQGGVFLNVFGEDLESVARPLMRVKVAYKVTNSSDWTDYTGCEVRNNTWMRCKTPNLYDYLPQLYKDRLDNNGTQINISSVQPRKKRYAEDASGLLQRLVQLLSSNNIVRIKRSTDQEITINDDDLDFTLGFKLDGVPSFKDLEKTNPQFARIDVLVNPTIKKFSPSVREFKPDWPHHHSSMDIKGENLDKGARLEDYIIKVGNEVCLVTKVLTQGLFFEPPSAQPDAVTSDGSIPVTMYVGNVNHIVGSLKYYGWWQSTEFIVIAVILSLLILAVLIFLGVCHYRKINDPHYLTRKQLSAANRYVGVPHQEKPLLERIDPELRQQIQGSLLRDQDNLQIGDEIGKGNFGKVYAGHLLEPVMRTKTHVAIKTVKGDTDKDSVEDFLKEAIIMKHFHHPNVLTLLGVTIKNDIPYVILPFMDNGDLKTYISNENNRFTVRDLVSFGLNISKGMAYLEQNHFVHRDLAARNCMVDKEKTIKIADFGLARDIYVADYYKVEDRSRPLPIRWMAIESIELQRFTTKSDVWSFGVVLWELLSRGLKPYPGIDNLDIKRYLKRGDRMEKPSHAPAEVYELMRKTWETQPDDRPTFKQVVYMLEQLLDGKKPTAEQPPPPNERKRSDAKPDNEFTNMKEECAASSQAPGDYLQLVDMPDTSTLAREYLPMK